MNKERLLKLADFLDTLPRNRFDFNRWVGPDWEGKPDLSCGTTACALGWATTIPAFRRLGFRMSRAFRAPSFKGLHVVQSAEKFFGLTIDEVELLFIPYDFACTKKQRLSQNATPKQVAKHIRKFVAAGGAK